MEIGPAVQSDLPELVEMLCLAYRRDLDSRFRAHLHEDCTYKLHQSRVGKIDGKIVSYVRISNRPIRIGGCTISMGGIGAVSTHPDYRGRGYNSLVLSDAVRYMQEHGYEMSMLFTGISGHYGKHGWVPFPEHSISVAPFSVPGATGERTQPPFQLTESAGRAKTAHTLRPFSEEKDLDGVIRIYNEHCEGRTGTLVRSPEYWRCGHSRLMGIMPSVVAERRGRLTAYLTHSISGQAVTVAEAGYLPTEPEVVLSLARFLIQQAIESDARQIAFRLGRLHPLPEVLCEISNGRMGHSESEGMMLRLINLQSLLQKLIHELRRRLRRSGFKDGRASLTLSADEQCATLRVLQNRITVEEGARGRTNLPLGMRPLLRMILGNATFSQMAALNDVHGITASVGTAALMDTLFPPQDFVYWGCDHF